MRLIRNKKFKFLPNNAEKLVIPGLKADKKGPELSDLSTPLPFVSRVPVLVLFVDSVKCSRFN